MALIVCFTGTEVKGYFRHFGSEILDFNRTGLSHALDIYFTSKKQKTLEVPNQPLPRLSVFTSTPRFY